MVVRPQFQNLVDRRAGTHCELEIYYQVIARSDTPTPDKDLVKMGPGQRSGMRRLLAALDDWQKSAERRGSVEVMHPERGLIRQSAG